jgi:SAM-dependent methyltransferase
MSNPLLDERHVVAAGGRLPLADDSVDLIVADFVFEHVDDPDAVASELRRVLREGGWICARTPNIHGYIAWGARAIPNSLHTRALRRLQPGREAVDVFPTRYRLNSPKALKRQFPQAAYTHASYGHFVDPPYFGNSTVLNSLVRAMSRFLPEALAPVWLVYIQARTRN